MHARRTPHNSTAGPSARPTAPWRRRAPLPVRAWGRAPGRAGKGRSRPRRGGPRASLDPYLRLAPCSNAVPTPGLRLSLPLTPPGYSEAPHYYSSRRPYSSLQGGTQAGPACAVGCERSCASSPALRPSGGERCPQGVGECSGAPAAVPGGTDSPPRPLRPNLRFRPHGVPLPSTTLPSRVFPPTVPRESINNLSFNHDSHQLNPPGRAGLVVLGC